MVTGQIDTCITLSGQLKMIGIRLLVPVQNSVSLKLAQPTEH